MDSSEDYKKDVYQTWADARPTSFPYPTDKEIKKQSGQYKEIIGSYLPDKKDSSILDLGCGYGFFLNTCRELGYRNIHGVELITDFKEIARKIFSIDSIVVSDIFSFLEKEQRYDVITAFDVLEHFKKSDIPRLLSLICKNLNPGGMFLFRAPNAESLSGLYILHSDLTHELGFTRLLTDEILEAASFADIRIFPSFVNSNPLIRLAQQIIARIFGLNDKFMFSSNLIGIGKK